MNLYTEKVAEKWCRRIESRLVWQRGLTRVPENARGVRQGMDMSWITDRIAVGGGIWTEKKMDEVARNGITHIIDMQMEFDDTALAEPFGIEVLWNPIDDDFRPKSPDVFQRGVEFALTALEQHNSKVYIHCAAGVHRAPMMTLALLRVLGFSLEAAIDLVEERRPVVDFADVYVRSVEEYVRSNAATTR